MIVILGLSGSGKTNFIRYVILNQKQIKLKTIDPKIYNFGSTYIVDTPCIANYECVNILIEDIKKISLVKFTHFIFFYESSFQNSIILKLQNYCLLNNIELIIFSNNIEFNISNIKIVESEKDLKNILLSIKDNFVIEHSNKYLATTNRKIEIMLLGTTNVGKSSIINSLINKNVFKVEDAKYTTTENTNCNFRIKNVDVKIYDTLGLERNFRGRINALKKLLNSVDYCFIVCDVFTYNLKLNNYIFNFLNKNKISCNFIVNKSDLINNQKKSEIYKFLFIKYKFVTPLITNINLKTIENEILLIANNNFLINNNKITDLIKKYFPYILYVKCKCFLHKYYHISLFTKSINKPNFNLLKNIIYKNFCLYNYYVYIEIIKFKKTDNNAKKDKYN